METVTEIFEHLKKEKTFESYKTNHEKYHGTYSIVDGLQRGTPDKLLGELWEAKLMRRAEAIARSQAHPVKDVIQYSDGTYGVVRDGIGEKVYRPTGNSREFLGTIVK